MAQTFDAIVYGGTAFGVIAAKAFSTRGKRVAIIEWTPSLGGLATGGLGITDGVRDTAWGLTKAFWNAIVAAGAPDVEVNSFGIPKVYKPSHARAALAGMLNGDSNITVFTNCWLQSVNVNAQKLITSIVTDVDTFVATEFIDCSYEGDLARLAGVSMTWGRAESTQTFGEPHAGVHRLDQTLTNARATSLRGDTFSSFQMPPQELDGQADAKLMAFSFRMSVSSKANRLPWPKPANYRREDFLDWIDEIKTRNFTKLSSITSYQMVGTDFGSTNGGVVSGPTSWFYPARRDKAGRLAEWDKVQYNMAGRYWTAANDPESPAALRADMALWGLPGDENQNPGEYYRYPGWSAHFYIREASRMRGRVIMTEANMITGSDLATKQPDSIGCGGYNPDSHACNTYPSSDLKRYAEGRMSIDAVAGNYQIPMRAIQPHPSQVRNLLVVGCPSVTRTVMTSFRIETTWMIIAEAAGIIGATAHSAGIPSGDIKYSAVLPALVAAGAKLNP